MSNVVLCSCYRTCRRVLLVGLVSLLSWASVMAIAAPPSYAQIPLNEKEVFGQTKAEVTGREKGEPLTGEERLDRAYDLRVGVGLLEEKRQAEGKLEPSKDNKPPVEATVEATKGAVKRAVSD